MVFPSPIARGEVEGVKSVLVQGEYRTGTGINIPEAERVVRDAVAFMVEHPDMSLGIATINIKQADYTRQAMDERYETDPTVRAYVDKWEPSLESFFVKNLENVQGDERDAIFISTVYGPDENGNVYQRFGPINSQTGHRRLNVLFTRAKHHVRLITSLQPSDVRPGPNSYRGVHVLREYLEYAATGRLETGSLTGGEPDSDFERFVVERLRNAGYGASCQVGVASYRIDIGIQHPANPHIFILGVECDGATYHSSRFARDRDQIRQQILEGLGWTLHRTWSTDWFANPEDEFERLEKSIEEALQSYQGLVEVVGEQTLEPEVVYNEHPISKIEGAEVVRETNTVAAPLKYRVTYVNPNDFGEPIAVVIGRDDGGWGDTVVSMDTPVARGLLGAHEGERVTLELPYRTEQVVVIRIERPSKK